MNGIKRGSGLLLTLLCGVMSVSSISFAAKGPHLEIATKGDAEIAYDKDTLTAPAGSTVQLTFKNNSTSLQHNFVLTKPGKAQEVAAAGLTAGEQKSFVPESPDVIAHTRLLNPGQSETITIHVPAEKGDYPFVCTFPGHAATMKGVLKAE